MHLQYQIESLQYPNYHFLEFHKSHKYYLNSDVRKEKITELKDIELTENFNIKKKFIKEKDGQIPFKELLKKERRKIKFNILEKAYFLSQSGRPGPVWIDIPANIQNAFINKEKLC